MNPELGSAVRKLLFINEVTVSLQRLLSFVIAAKEASIDISRMQTLPE